MIFQKRTKTGLFVGNSPDPDPRLVVIKRDQGKLRAQKTSERARKAEERLKLKSYKDSPNV